MNSIKTLENLKTSSSSTSDIPELQKKCYEAMNDDFNAPILVANLFEGARIINSVNDGKETISAEDLDLLKKLMNDFVFDVLGLRNDNSNASNNKVLEGVMEIILDLRKEAKGKKDFAMSDKLRDELAKNRIMIKDTKEGVNWTIEQ
jgi:cysteinyl-tRNA synthetase